MDAGSQFKVKRQFFLNCENVQEATDGYCGAVGIFFFKKSEKQYEFKECDEFKMHVSLVLTTFVQNAFTLHRGACEPHALRHPNLQLATNRLSVLRVYRVAEHGAVGVMKTQQLG
jgi:hypothetical protein